MSRWIDFLQLERIHTHIPRLATPRRGLHEIDVLEDTYSIDIKALEQGGYLFPAQFKDCDHEIFPPEIIHNLERAFDWLDQTIPGPWEWRESGFLLGGTRTISFSVYIERIPDQLAFKGAFPTLFSYEPLSPLEMTKVALLRGVIPAADMSEVTRQLSSDFLAYLRGEGDSYVIPHSGYVRPETSNVVPFRNQPCNE